MSIPFFPPPPHRNFVRVSSGPELGAYYHEFFLRDKPHLAAQMFCKNARTKIAMAASSEPKNVPVKRTVEVKTTVPIATPKLPEQKKQMDAAQLALMRRQLDPGMQLLIEQQLNACQQHIALQQQQNAILGLANTGLGGSVGNLNLFQSDSSVSLLAIQQQIEAQKKQQENMLQLRQYLALNLQQQKNRRTASNIFRASAA